MKTTPKPLAMTRRAKTPHSVDPEHAELTWSQLFDEAHWHYFNGYKEAAVRMMDAIARYAGTITLRRAAADWPS